MVKVRTKPKRPQKPAHETALLVTRYQAALTLGGVSSMTLHRLEHAGRLTPRRLTPCGMVFYSVNEVRQVAEGDAV
jgi:hypothetical protein